MKIWLIWFCFFLCPSLVYAPLAYSAVILKTKGRKALVDLEGKKAKKGDTFSALNLYGKAKGLLKIKKVKKGKAIAVLLKGKMGSNWILEPSVEPDYSRSLASEAEEIIPIQAPKGGNLAISSSASSSMLKKVNSSAGFGVLVGGHVTSIKLTDTGGISGYSPQGALMVDLSFMEHAVVEPSLRLLAGYWQVKAGGSGPACGRHNPCSLLLHYPGVGVLIRAVFLKNLFFQPWIGGGGNLFWPIVQAGADLGLDQKSFESFHGSVAASLGADIHFKTFYVPISLDFNWVNPFLISLRAVQANSKEFKPFYMGVKLGIAFSF